ncbi:MAG TPA: hypothetical protein VEA79_14205 [Phenylobacterium sp.]|nr:hypothetical protein [Phenylobacterium sp.]
MRAILFAAVVAATPLAGLAQTLDPYANDNLRWMEQERLRRQTDQLERDMLSLENRLRANEAIQRQQSQDLATAQARARIARNLANPPSTLAPVRGTDIPDDRLAASNARVRAASGQER